MEHSALIKTHEAYDCLKYIRIAPGKVYEYELYKYIAESDRMINEGVGVADSINQLFGLEFTCCDHIESSSFGEGLNVVFTNPKFRLIVDLLLSQTEDYVLDYTVYVDAIQTKEVEDGSIEVSYAYNEVKEVLYKLRQEYPDNRFIFEAEKVFSEQWARKQTLKQISNHDIAEMIRNCGSEASVDLAGKCIVNFNYPEIRKWLGGHAPICRLNAAQSLWIGDVINFSGAVFLGGATFRGALIQANKFIFTNTSVQLDKCYRQINRDFENNELTFRNTRILTRELFFDELNIYGDEDNKKLSFEDSKLDSTFVSFSKMQMNDASLFCFQTLMPYANVRMIEPLIRYSELIFEDSMVDAMILLNASEIPDADFKFRSCNNLILNNCVIKGTIQLDNICKLSLNFCKNEGHVTTNWSKRSSDKHEQRFPILQSILVNDDSDKEKAQQFILLKENFASLGQYDHEDDAFILYMNNKETNHIVRGIFKILRIIGDYGISPIKVLISMLVLTYVFGMFFFVNALIQPMAYNFSADSGVFTCLFNSLYLSVANLISYNAEVMPMSTFAIVTSVIESITGWFMLGYLSVAVLRKTLR